MAAGPALFVFPPVEQVNRRRESLDNLIRKSMDMRPTGPWPNQSPVTKVRTARTRPNGVSSPSDTTPVIRVEVHEDNLEKQQPSQPVVNGSKEENAPPKATPFQMLPPIQVPKRNPSRPRRSSSVTERSRGLVPASNLAQRRAMSPRRQKTSQSPADYDDQMFAPAAAQSNISTPVSALSSGSTPISAQSSNSTPISPPERDAPSRSSNRQRVIVPNSSSSGEVASFYSPGTQMPLQRQGSSRASNRSRASNVPLQRQVSSRASNRTRSGYPPSPESKRSATPAFSEAGTFQSGSSTLVRSNSAMTQTKWSPQGYEESVPMQSMFPVYDPRLPLVQQSYRPARVQPLVLLSPEQVSKPEYSPTFQKEAPPPTRKEATFITPAANLASLWSTANGQMSTPDPRKFALKMFRPSSNDKKQKITFGSEESKPFYSLAKSHPEATEEDEEHELLISRHHTSKEDILPVSHLHLQPPPPPTISKSNRGSVLSDIHEPASQITTIAPILATLHSLDNAAKTPQAHTLALVDPNATSPAAARLAERAVAEATARESCTLTWTPTCARTGKYELHHPSLGVFTIVTNGDVKSAFEGGPARGATSISIINPFANMTPLATSPSSLGSASSSSTVVNEAEREAAVIARLDLQEDVLHLDAASIQQLGNLYLIDVCVSAILAVAVAEAKRPADPGLIFAAPPPSLMNVSIKSRKSMKSIKAIIPKKPKKMKKNKDGTLNLSFDHLAGEDDLPKITKGILSVLGFSFKTAVYLLAVSVKVTASMVIGISKLATKDS